MKNIIKNPNIIVGDYTYYDDFENIENFEKNIKYHFDFIGDKLIIHKMDGIKGYPFYIFGKDWGKSAPKKEELPNKGDTVVENDVWIGHNVVIMPGVKIGNGAIISTNSTVTKNVEPYTIVGGNPAIVINLSHYRDIYRYTKK